jgi:deoxyribodipyrimidine photo-lyase
VKFGNPLEIISELVDEYKVACVNAVEPPAFEERQLQNEVEKVLWKKSCVLNVYDANTLFEIKELPFPLKQLPDVFTKFRTIIEKECSVNEPLFFSEKIISPKFPEFEIPTEIENLIKDVKVDERSAFPFNGGLKNAQSYLNSYIFEKQLIATYKETRNQMVGADYSTKFSPWLALGCISPREIMFTVSKFEKDINKNESTYWVYFELLWREYFHWVMRKYDKLFFLKNGIKKSAPIVRSFDEKRFLDWKNGETGEDFIDANMKELNLTGFMSNRGRQNVASYLCNDLQMDWRYGAAYFEEQLIDYDVCSNWGNWAYIAGVGNDPRGHRVFNIQKQANDYDKDFTFRKVWLNH